MFQELTIVFLFIIFSLVVIYKIFFAKKVFGPGVFEVAAILAARYEKTHQCFYYWFAKWGYEHKVDIPIWGTNKAILYTDPAAFRAVLNFPSFVKNRVQFFQPILGDSIGVCNDKADWMKRKQVATKYFSSQRVKQMLPILADEIQVLMDKITPGKPFPIHENLGLFTTNLVSRFLFSYDLRLQQGDNSEMIPLMNDLVNRCLFRLLIIFPYYNYFGINRTFLHNREKLRSIFAKIVDARNIERETPGYQPKDDLLEGFMDVGIDRISLFGEICAALWPGKSHAGPIAFWLYEIARNQDIQERIQSELDGFMSKDKKVPTWEDLTNNMPYTTQVVMEGLRRYPLYPIVTRSTVAGCTLGGETYPKDAEFYTCPYVINNNPRYWKDPWKFDPERFGPNGEGKGNDSLLTFNIGNRPCLAAHYVTAEAKLLIAMILNRFKVTLNTKSSIQENIFVTLIPSREIHLVFEPRM